MAERAASITARDPGGESLGGVYLGCRVRLCWLDYAVSAVGVAPSLVTMVTVFMEFSDR